VSTMHRVLFFAVNQHSDKSDFDIQFLQNYDIIVAYSRYQTYKHYEA
jgi:hypothetical protein